MSEAAYVVQDLGYWKTRSECLRELVEQMSQALSKLTGRPNNINWDGVETEVQRRVAKNRIILPFGD